MLTSTSRPLLAAGISTVIAAAVLFLLTFWVFFAFLWALPLAAGIWQIRVARSPEPTPEELRAAAWAGLVAACVCALNPVGIAGSAWVLREVGAKPLPRLPFLG
jgi:hypothetical protein